MSTTGLTGNYRSTTVVAPALTFAELVANEVRRALAEHPAPFHSLHEGYAVALEEFDELWDEIRKKVVNRPAVLCEAVQAAAMLQRMAEETGLI